MALHCTGTGRSWLPNCKGLLYKVAPISFAASFASLGAAKLLLVAWVSITTSPATGVTIFAQISTFKVNLELDYNLLALTCPFAWFVATI